MKALQASIIIGAVASAAATAAQAKPGQAANQSAVQLNRALAAVATTLQATPPPKTVDHDQGDDHANPGAIAKVCSKDTPAAVRAAICPVSVSPE